MGDGEVLHCQITADLSMLRRRIEAFAAAAGLAAERLDDLVLAVNEAADNVLEHGAGSGRIVARADSSSVWVEIIDPAGTLSEGHLYRHGDGLPPAALRGYGLWMMRRLCDRVVLDHPDGHARLRLYMRYQPSTPSVPPRSRKAES
ncbi:ATP-binding protein [Nonomuraea roseoviolacea]|uniref:Anti-sigma regulatory factor (Ser/Thr protein kinase) n=1 Tax=Nonomuraea roseoviolacea subsp. carminata TaxID=160689 RepID=A0ABT1KCB0_9ACTN|nr:ATP-binding protein [Nonomuraea roseoviolacea]MCP2351646.1 anti-sigma regulatory factor (Ser/Thr protein kinase) [Nonomuraea roseoviolacea subsp. carminata]